MEEKYRIVKEIQNGKKKADVAELFNPPFCQSTTATIVKNKKEIICAYEEGLFINKRKKMMQSYVADVDKALAEWFKKCEQ